MDKLPCLYRHLVLEFEILREMSDFVGTELSDLYLVQRVVSEFLSVSVLKGERNLTISGSSVSSNHGISYAHT